MSPRKARTENTSTACLTYCRVSTQEQKKHQTIDGQLAPVIRLAEGHGLEPVSDPLCDDGVSGTHLEGRKLKDALEQIEAGTLKIGFVVCVDVDRILRMDWRNRSSREDANRIVGTLIDHRIRIVTEHQGTINPDDALQWLIRAGVSADEWQKIQDRMERGRKDKLSKNVYCWRRVPYGYQRIYKDPTIRRSGYTVVPDPERVEVLHVMLRAWISGGLIAAKRALEAAEIPAPYASYDFKVRCHQDPEWKTTTWTTGSISDLIRKIDSYHSGDWPYEYRGEHGTLTLQPIVDDELWLAVKARLKEPKTREDHRVWLTTGTVECAVCGRGLVTVAALPYYQRIKCPKCLSKSPKAEAERFVWRCALIRLAEVLTASGQVDGGELEQRVSELTEKRADVMRRMSVLVELRESGQIEPETYRSRYGGHKATLSNLDEDLARAKKALEAAGAETGRLRALRERVSDVLGAPEDSVSVSRQREVLRMILPPGQKAKVAWRPDGKLELALPAVAGLKPCYYQQGGKDLDQMWGLVQRMGVHGFRVLDDGR